PTDDLAGVVALADGLEAMPADLPADDVTHLHGKPLTRAGKQRLPRRLPASEVFRVHVDSFSKLVPGDSTVGIVPTHLERSRGEEVQVCGDVPIPVSRLTRS